MELAKSLFKPNIHEGYVGREDKVNILEVNLLIINIFH